MFRFRRNKSELIVLTGAIYAFVAYLTAFTLEILFIIDLTRRSNEILTAISSSPSSSTTNPLNRATSSLVNAIPINDLLTSRSATPTATSASSNIASLVLPQQLTSADDGLFMRNTGLDRFKFEAIQAHITVSCLAISILYFIVFIISLVLIVALILRSTFMLLIWMCAMITMYLPEFCLVAYVSVYCWGPDTRNGQTEIVFYLLRAILNAIFIFRAHKLFKQLNYEKNFFRLKSGGRTSVSSQFAGYDSPYYVGDSLTTTINPVFNSSTLNLNRYDYIRDHHFQNNSSYGHNSSSRGQSPATNNSLFEGDFSNDQSRANSSALSNGNAEGGQTTNMFNLATGARARLGHQPSLYSMTRPVIDPMKELRDRQGLFGNHRESPNREPHNYSKNLDHPARGNRQLGKFYLGEVTQSSTRPASMMPQQKQQRHRTSVLSINDDLAECELDLDYRTLGRPTRQADRRSHERGDTGLKSEVTAYNYDHHHHHNHHHRLHHHHQQQQHRNSQHRQHLNYNQPALSRSQDNLASYSTQSLDRRNIKDFALTEQVILSPLGHQPFEYLHRPGSTSNLDCLTSDIDTAAETRPHNSRNNNHQQQQQHHHHHHHANQM